MGKRTGTINHPQEKKGTPNVLVTPIKNHYSTMYWPAFSMMPIKCGIG
jgi:hypothetical protein